MGIFDLIGSLLGYMCFYLWKLFGSYGWTIVVATIILRLLMVPSMYHQHKNQMMMTKLSKKQEEIRKMYANNKKKQQEELMKLQEREGMNPMGGCLQMILPLVFFSGFFGMMAAPLKNMLHLSGAKVDAAVEVVKNNPMIDAVFNTRYGQLDVIRAVAKYPDQFQMFSADEKNLITSFNDSTRFFGLDLFSTVQNTKILWIIPILCIVTSILSMLIPMLMNKNQPQMNKGCNFAMMLLMPALFVIWLIGAPAALGIYYLTGNILMCIQSYVFYKFFSASYLTARQEAARISLRTEQEKLIK